MIPHHTQAKLVCLVQPVSSAMCFARPALVKVLTLCYPKKPNTAVTKNVPLTHKTTPQPPLHPHRTDFNQQEQVAHTT